MNMLPYSGFPALPKNIEDMHNQLVTLGLNDVEALTARIKKCEDWVDNVEETELTGNPVVFQNALAVPAKSLTATLNPIQDLHGYDKPWAGGSQKNKATTVIYKQDYVMSSNGTETASTGYCITDKIPVTAGQGYACSFKRGTAGQTDPLRVGAYKSDNTFISRVNVGNSGDPYTVPSDTAYIRLSYCNDNTLAAYMYDIQVELGNTATSYEPYSNICPISGRTETSVTTRNEDNTETASATISFGQTVYGGQVDFKTGNVTVEWGYIASYNGETLPGAWISDRDVYVSGTTPTAGAEVAYKLATPTELTLTPAPAQLEMLKGYNRVSSDDESSLTITAYTGGPWEAVTRAIKKVTNKTKTTKKRRK